MRSILWTQSATHRGAPFAGRRREIGILTHLIEEGLAGGLCLVRVAGKPGSGRRRVLAEALHQGPDAEWVHLAPGDVEADLKFWVRTELLDLIETYPAAPYPSWALHVLARWEPELRRWAPIPAMSRERLPLGQEPEVVGAAMGALLRAVTGQSRVIVDAGIWPEKRSRTRRILESLCRSLRDPGAVVLAAAGPSGIESVDPPGVRTLALGPLEAEEIEDLVRLWNPDTDPEPFAGWLRRLTGGHPFFIHEAVRWLEEMGHLRVDDEAGRVILIDPVERLPLPFNLRAVMDSRYHRLPPASARLLHLLAHNDGTLEIEALRRRFHASEDEIFDEAFAHLRRREFLLRRSVRHPVAAAGTLWRGVVDDAVKRLPRLKHRDGASEHALRASPVSSPLAVALARLAALRSELAGGSPPAGAHPELARIAALLRRRTGPAWDGLRGRLAYLAALVRRGEGRTAAAARWACRGFNALSPEIHPGLRRSLARLLAEMLESAARSGEAQTWRERARAEALAAGHLVAAAVLQGVEAEGRRRLGRADTARRMAEAAEVRLAAMGLDDAAALAAYTHIRALLDLRRLDEAEEAIAAARSRGRSGLQEAAERLEALRDVPPIPATETLDPQQPHPSGWGWGLDSSDLYVRGRESLMRATEVSRVEGAEAMERVLAEVDHELEAAGQLADLADLWELRVWGWLHEHQPDVLDARLEKAARLHHRLESPGRIRFFAEALRTTPAIGLPVFTRVYRPLVLGPAIRRHAGNAPVTVGLRFTGLVRAERPGSRWPMALWPEWWLRLWATAAARDRMGTLFSREEAEGVLAAAGDAPEAPFESLIQLANQLLRGHEVMAGGLVARDGRLTVDWSGIECDLVRFERDLAEADRLAAAGESVPAAGAADRALRALRGAFLPGLDEPDLVAVAGRLAGEVDRAARLAAAREPDPETRTAWLEGAGRAGPVAAVLAPLMERAGLPRSARALGARGNTGPGRVRSAGATETGSSTRS
jgi:hypothetical protein